MMFGMMLRSERPRFAKRSRALLRFIMCFSGSVRHTKVGIAKVMYTSADLLASHLGFEASQSDMIRNRVLHPQLPAARPSTVALTDRLSRKTAIDTQ
jgi:hypothetical protein